MVGAAADVFLFRYARDVWVEMNVCVSGVYGSTITHPYIQYRRRTRVECVMCKNFSPLNYLNCRGLSTREKDNGVGFVHSLFHFVFDSMQSVCCFSSAVSFIPRRRRRRQHPRHLFTSKNTYIFRRSNERQHWMAERAQRPHEYKKANRLWKIFFFRIIIIIIILSVAWHSIFWIWTRHFWYGITLQTVL